MPLRLFNALTLRKEIFKPLRDKKVGFYACGPTVYDFAHIGNFRSYIFADILKRTLKFNGYKTTWVMNITDVDDKTINNSKKDYPDLEPKAALLKFTKKYEKIFWQDLFELNISRPDKIPHATGFIPQMQELVVNILAAGYGYEKENSFFFNVEKYSKDHRYGQLVNLDLEQLKTGERIRNDEYGKEDIQDFVLWKAAKEGEPSWNFKYQNRNYSGRPGWHIECSAMSSEYLGVPFDIHTGGIDLKFPHHENEIAQTEAAFGKIPAKFWLYNEHLFIDGNKMSKSLGNLITLDEISRRFNPLAYRYLVLTAHYRSPLNMIWESLKAAQIALDNLYRTIWDLKLAEARNFWLAELLVKIGLAGKKTKNIFQAIKKYEEDFLEIINDDLDTPKAVALAWQLIEDGNIPPAGKKKLLFRFDEIFGLQLNKVKIVPPPAEIKKLAAQRDQYRHDKQWEKADILRAKIEEKGWLAEDTAEGTKLKPKEIK